MHPFNDPNLQQGMLFNHNFNSQNANLGNLNGANPNNFLALNPNLQPMAQNNQLGILHLLAAQIQSNPHLQINLLNQLQIQNLVAPFQQGSMPVMGHNPNQMMVMPHGQFLAQQQMLQGNQMMGLSGNPLLGLNNIGSGFGNAPNNIGQNFLYGSPAAVTKSKQPQMSSSPVKTQWNKKNMQQANGSQKFQINHIEAKITDHSPVQPRNSARKGSAGNFGFRKDLSNNSFQKSQFHEMRGSRRNMKQLNRRGGRGQHNQREQKLQSTDPSEEAPTVRQRPLPLNYTNIEIQQWREARKKNFPTRANMVKKKVNDRENDEDADAKLRRQQLREVLAKQAELGVEVAEIPPSYLREPEHLVPKKENEREVTGGPSGNKFNYKRGRGHGRYNSHCKRQKFNKKGVPTSPPSVKREPSLLEKLLSNDIKRDKIRLLQVFRFMVLNDFFKQWPGKPLEFPVITVKDDGGCGSKIVGEADPSPADVVVKKTSAKGISSQKESSVAEQMENESDEEDTFGTGELVNDRFESSEEGEIMD